jgi:hypothetical protein
MNTELGAGLIILGWLIIIPALTTHIIYSWWIGKKK